MRFNNKSLGFLWHNYVTIFEATRMRDIQKIQITSKNSGSRRPAGGSHLHWNLVFWSTEHEAHRDQWEKLWDLWDPQKKGHLGRLGGLIWYGKYLGASEVGLLAGREPEGGFSTNPLREVKTQQKPNSFVAKTRLRELT